VIDTHAHLGDDAAEVVARAHEAGVSRIVDVATTLAGARESLDRAERFEGVYASIGIHPPEAGSVDGAAAVDGLRELLSHPRAIAVGETGLDYFRDYAPHDAQQRLFDQQLALARETGKPVVIHTRSADDDTRTRLLEHEGPVVLHCFSSEALLDAALERRWYVSFAGNVTYKNAYDLRAAARRVPDDRLLAETDSPYLTPQAVRGRRNEPAYVVHTLAVLAEARGADPAELERRIEANATEVFGL
jgi:TatD DNase family protein